MQHSPPHTPSSRAPDARPRPAPPRRPIGGCPPGRPSAVRSPKDDGRSPARGAALRRQLLVAAGAVGLFLACLALVLLGARAAAAGGRPLPPAPALQIPLDPPLSPGEPLVTLPWGDGAGAVGLDPAGDGLRRAPWTLAVAPDARIAVLDGVNRRVVALDARGAFLNQLPLDLADPRFLAVENGVIHVLDPDVDRRLVTLDWQGAVLASLALQPLAEPVSGLFSRNGEPLVETAHSEVFGVTAGGLAPVEIPVGDTVSTDSLDEAIDNAMSTATGAGATPAGTPQQPPSRTADLVPAAGRPLRAGDQGSARCAFSPPADVRVTVISGPPSTSPGASTAAGPATATSAGTGVDVQFPWALEHLVSLDGDVQGNLVLGARLREPRRASAASDVGSTGAGSQSGGASLVVTRLPAERLWNIPSAPAHDPDAPALLLAGGGVAETGAPFVVAPDGRVYQPRVADDGYTILVHSFPEE